MATRKKKVPEIDLIVPTLGYGIFIGATVARTYQPLKKFTFIKLADGRVFSTYGQELNLATAHRMNDATRKVYANLAGIPWPELKAAIRKEREASRAREIDRDLERFKREATRRGFTLVKKRGDVA